MIVDKQPIEICKQSQAGIGNLSKNKVELLN